MPVLIRGRKRRIKSANVNSKKKNGGEEESSIAKRSYASEPQILCPIITHKTNISQDEVENEDAILPIHDIEDAVGDHFEISPDFHFVWEGILEMRSAYDAPVDIMGCDKLADPLREPKVQRFQHLVAASLSSQTTDQCTAACMNRLKAQNLTVDVINSMDLVSLEGLLRGVSFHKTKAKNLKKIVQILKTQYDSDIPQSYQELCALPGIGPKMALLILTSAWDRVEGIAVDIHVHRIANRLGWIQTKTPQQSCVALTQRIPKSLHRNFNSVLVGFGQQRCKALNPLCNSCLVLTKCPYGQSHLNSKQNQALKNSESHRQITETLSRLSYNEL